MPKAASMTELEKLHSLITQSFTKRIEEDIRDGIPTDAATLSSAVKFLKDNAVTADPADADDLGALRDKLAKQAKERRERGSNVVALATADLQQMEA